MKLKECRQRAGMTQEQAAAALGMPKKTYQNYEREVREADPDVLCAIADLYKVSLDELMGRDGARHDSPRTLAAEAAKQQDELLGIFQSLDADGREFLLRMARTVEEYFER